MDEAPRIGYGLGARGLDLQGQTWELRGRSSIGAAAFVARRVADSFREGLRMQLDQDRFTLGGRELRYYTPLEALGRGRIGAPLPRRMATLLWRCLAERCVELPIARDFLDARPWKRLLEVGNVLGYWYPLGPHVVVDKYERGDGLLNVDLLDYAPDEPFDTIVSISTLEHIGFDEPERDPGKFLRAIRKLETLLAPRGRLLVTVPIGYNPSVDRAVVEGELGAYTTHALVGEASGRRGWHEVLVKEALARREGILVATRG